MVSLHPEGLDLILTGWTEMTRNDNDKTRYDLLLAVSQISFISASVSLARIMAVQMPWGNTFANFLSVRVDKNGIFDQIANIV